MVKRTATDAFYQNEYDHNIFPPNLRMILTPHLWANTISEGQTTAFNKEGQDDWIIIIIIIITITITITIIIITITIINATFHFSLLFLQAL